MNLYPSYFVDQNFMSRLLRAKLSSMTILRYFKWMLAHLLYTFMNMHLVLEFRPDLGAILSESLCVVVGCSCCRWGVIDLIATIHITATICGISCQRSSTVLMPGDWLLLSLSSPSLKCKHPGNSESSVLNQSKCRRAHTHYIYQSKVGRDVLSPGHGNILHRKMTFAMYRVSWFTQCMAPEFQY